MPESIPKRGDLVLHDPTSEIGIVLGWVKDTILMWSLPEKEPTPLIYQEGDFKIIISREDLEKINSFLPTKIDLAIERSKEE